MKQRKTTSSGNWKSLKNEEIRKTSLKGGKVSVFLFSLAVEVVTERQQMPLLYFSGGLRLPIVGILKCFALLCHKLASEPFN